MPLNLAAAWALYPLIVAGAPPSPAPETTTHHQPWPVIVDGGVQALGFKPFPAHPTLSVGTEARLVDRNWYALHLGVAAAGMSQAHFARALFVDGTIGQRFATRFGLYGDLDLVMGGQAARVPGVTYSADDGQFRARRAPIRVAARLGLGVALGLDFGRLTSAPVRLFARYRQYVWAPFMTHNTVPVMGFATTTFGVAVEIGTLWTRK